MIPHETEITPHPLLDLIINWKVAASIEPFIISAVMEDPQPVSVNELYTSGKYGEKVLTAKGRNYKDGLSTKVARASFDWKRAVEMVYQGGVGATLGVVLYFEKLSNKSWKPGRKTEAGNLQQPYLIKDASNYIKIIEDGVSEGCGINDCNNMAIIIAKEEDPRRPRTELVYIVA